MTDQKSDARGVTVDSLVFVGFNAQVIAIDRYTGEIAWSWKAPNGTGFVAILVDGDRLIVSVNGYTYCLDPVYGQEVWANRLKGFGVGIPCVASVRGSTFNQEQAAAGAVIAQQQAASSSATTAAVVT